MLYELTLCEYFFIIGLVISISYDSIAILRKTIRHNRIAIAVEDFVYWFFMGIFMYILIYIINNMEFRYYIAFSLFLGVLVYRIGIGRVVVKVISTILIFVKNMVLKKVYKKVNILYKRLGLWFRGKCSGRCRIFKKLMGFKHKLCHKYAKKDGIVHEKK